MKTASPIRVITATAIFDGHDASINIIRRLLQDKGMEVIHLGHNRSVKALVDAALQEDVDAICISSYQGAHLEYFKYLFCELISQHAGDILIFVGGGGTISEKDVSTLQENGVTKVYTAINSTQLGLPGIVNEINTLCLESGNNTKQLNEEADDVYTLARKISKLQISKLQISELQNSGSCGVEGKDSVNGETSRQALTAKVIGVTGTGGAGKSTLIDERLKTFLHNHQLKIACIAIDPARQKTGGALLGDSIRINSSEHPALYFRSLSTRTANTSITPLLYGVLGLLDAHGFNLIVIAACSR